MGKGDRKTKKGKISMGTFGVRRPRPSHSNAEGGTTTAEKPAKKSTKKKTEKKS
jgi:30S ribosomal protein S31